VRVLVLPILLVIVVWLLYVAAKPRTEDEKED
jgi:hypothetical protein